METELQAVILVFSLLFLAALTSIALKRVRLPFTVAVFLLGLLLGMLAVSYGPGLEAGAHEAAGHGESQGFLADFLASLQGLGGLSPDLILFIFLPPLIYESAFALDARKLLKNLGPILTLAIPALLLSTVIVAAALRWGVGDPFGVTWPVALLFGALISATDPVAVVALFKELGAPPRLGILVEGESLFNDGTAIVLFNILLGVVAGTSASASAGALVLAGTLSFLKVFLGGVAVGLVLAFVFAQIISWVRNDHLVEITLTTVLAYASFVVAEHYFHVSGVMATVAAGVTLSSYGRTKISPPVQEFMREFWHYLAYVANALIFFLVGIVIPMRVELSELGPYLVPLGITLVAVVAARAAGVFSLVPLLGRFTEKIDRRFQAVMFWGGLRGAVALALVLAVANDPNISTTVKNLFLTLAGGVIVTTLLVNALTIRPLLEYFGLNKYDRAELFQRGEGMLSVLQRVKGEVGRLREEKNFAPPVLDRLEQEYNTREQEMQAELKALKTAGKGFSPELEETVFLGQCLTVERRAYLELYARGILPEKTTKALQHSVDLLLDLLKAGVELPEDRYARPWTVVALTRVLTALEAVPLLGSWPGNRKASLLADAYDTARGLDRGCHAVLDEIREVRHTGAVDPLALNEVERCYQNWMYRARERINRMAVQYPEYVEKVQALLAGRLCLNLELEGYRHLGELGVIPDKVVDEMTHRIEEEMARIRRFPHSALQLDVRDLLRQVPFFRDVPNLCIEELAKRSRSRTVLEEEKIFREGDRGDSLYLIGRGAVRISVSSPERILAVLGAGEFFGEMALLSARPRTATAVAATPANLIELTRRAVEEVEELVPELRGAMLEAYRQRLVDQALARHPAFADLNLKQRKTLVSAFRPVTLAPGQELGDQGPCLLVVRSGELLVDSRRLTEGDIHGVEVFTGTHAPHGSVKAQDTAAVFILGPAELEHLRDAAPDIPALVSHRLQQTA
ncbi:MAG: cation:proton antiporter, partial [Terriglobia bacterium]